MKPSLAVMIILLLASPVSMAAKAATTDEAPFHVIARVIDTFAEVIDFFAGYVDPFPSAFGISHVSLQAGLNDSFALTGYGTSGGFFDNIRILSVSVGLRYYPATVARNGLYIGPFLNYTQVSEESALVDYTMSSRRASARIVSVGYTETSGFFGYGVELGAVIDVGEPFFIDLGAGLMRYSIAPAAGFPMVIPVCSAVFGAKF